MVLIVSLITLLSTILYSRYLKGFLGQLPLILGAATGCIAAGIVMLITDVSLFSSMPDHVLESSVWKLGD